MLKKKKSSDNSVLFFIIIMSHMVLSVFRAQSGKKYQYGYCSSLLFPPFRPLISILFFNYLRKEVAVCFRQPWKFRYAMPAHTVHFEG